ncbi:MAG TPA: hypothetical protein VGO93_17010, partial [Candidatus Xenobia bacterium]
MRKLLWLLLLVVPAFAEAPWVLQPQFETRLAPTVHVRKDVSADATVRLFLQVYRIAGPRIGCRLVDPADLLTLSGSRGLTSWNMRWPVLTGDDLQRLEAVDRLLAPQGISVECSGPSLDEEMVNLAGVERMCRTSHMPATIPYDSQTGWVGYYQWQTQQMNAYDQQAPVPQQNRDHVYYGLMLGYPDRAILGYMQYDSSSQNARTIASDIPFTSYYECGVPSFNFLPDDLAAVQPTIKAWGRLLQAIYRHPAMVRLDADPAFRQARRAFLAIDKEPDMGWWSDERGRLGMWSKDQWATFRAFRDSASDRHEQVFQACAPRLTELVRQDANTDALLQLCNETAATLHVEALFDANVLYRWAELGYYVPSGPHHDFFQAAHDAHPAFFKRWKEPSPSP